MFKKILQTGIFIIVLFSFSMSLAITANAGSVEGNVPDFDNLLYKFETERVAGDNTKTTTDYIATLPEGRPETIVGRVLRTLLILANVLAFISFVVAGVYMVISQGDEQELSKAKRIFLYTIIAMVVCATSLALAMGVVKFDFF